MIMNKKEKADLIQIVECDDGSHTLYRKDLDEHYHSTFGAVSESKHIFIDAGFKYLSRNLSEINILEVGFGTGLNAFLTLLEVEKNDIKVHYTGVETIKLTEEVISKLNYAGFIGNENSATHFYSIHQCSWEEKVEIISAFSLIKIESKIEDVEIEKNHFDLVYFDAFAPDVQAELWTKDVFLKIYNAMKPAGVLVTYSCKGDVKRALKSVGFRIEKLPGPKGKREFLRAYKD